MEARTNGQGHHPKARPYEPHNKNGLVKVVGLAPLSKLCLGNSDDELLEPIVVEMGCAEPKMWYVDTAGCGRLQANPANPPPRNGFVRKAMRYAAVLILSLMVVAGASSCQKPPEPTPQPTPTPVDTITPVNPIDTITPVNPGDTLDPISYDTIPGRKVDLWVGIWMPESGHEGIRYPTKDTIRFYANHPGCDTIFIKWYIPPNLTNSWTPGAFHSPRDTLKALFRMSPKIYGGKKIYVNENYGGASIPCADSMNISKLGMTECDSAIFAGWGYKPTRLHFGKTR